MRERTIRDPTELMRRSSSVCLVEYLRRRGDAQRDYADDDDGRMGLK